MLYVQEYNITIYYYEYTEYNCHKMQKSTLDHSQDINIDSVDDGEEELGGTPKFRDELMRHSVNYIYEDALTEWTYVFKSSIHAGFTYCICGQKIRNTFYIKNSLNGESLIIGSECVKHISDEFYKETQKINRVIKKINKATITEKDIELIRKYNIYDKITDKEFKELDTDPTLKEIKMKIIKMHADKVIYNEDVDEKEIKSLELQYSIGYQSRLKKGNELVKIKLIDYMDFLKIKKTKYAPTSTSDRRPIIDFNLELIGTYYGSEKITEWEHGFMESIMIRGNKYKLSPKQDIIKNRILNKLRSS